MQEDKKEKQREYMRTYNNNRKSQLRDYMRDYMGKYNKTRYQDPIESKIRSIHKMLLLAKKDSLRHIELLVKLDYLENIRKVKKRPTKEQLDVRLGNIVTKFKKSRGLI